MKTQDPSSATTSRSDLTDRLREQTRPKAECPFCGRRSYSEHAIGEACNKRRLDGERCPGTMVAR